MPAINEANYVYTAGRNMTYKICPETDCEEVSPTSEPDISIVEKFKKQDDQCGQKESRSVMMWFDKTVGKSTW